VRRYILLGAGFFLFSVQFLLVSCRITVGNGNINHCLECLIVAGFPTNWNVQHLACVTWSGCNDAGVTDEVSLFAYAFFWIGEKLFDNWLGEKKLQFRLILEHK
jgi:hypothetical protein